MFKLLKRIFWPSQEPILGFCKTCGQWTETRYIRVYRNRKVERQATCAICKRWRWG